MPTLTDLYKLIESFAAAIPDLNMDGDEQEEYSTMLLRLQNQVELGEPDMAIVSDCLDWLNRFSEERLSPIRAIAV
jgi:hypothetical protein